VGVMGCGSMNEPGFGNVVSKRLLVLLAALVPVVWMEWAFNLIFEPVFLNKLLSFQSPETRCT